MYIIKNAQKYDQNKRENMKAILEFNLPEEQYDFEMASNAMKLRDLIADLDKSARDWLKYGGMKFKSKQDVLEWMRDQINEVRQIIEQ